MTHVQERYDELLVDVDRMASAYGVILRALLASEDPAVVADVVAICERYACGVIDRHQVTERGAA